jgi:hypothetical protein
MVYVPVATPAPPNPWIARPTMNPVLPGATAQIKLPKANTNTATRNDALTEKYFKILPHDDWKPPKVIRYAELYHEIWLRSLKSSVILGIAVAMIV